MIKFFAKAIKGLGVAHRNWGTEIGYTSQLSLKNETIIDQKNGKSWTVYADDVGGGGDIFIFMYKWIKAS